MKVMFSPVRMDEQLSATVAGDSITLNGEVLDFRPLLEGETLPQGSISNPWIVGVVERVNGEIYLTLRIPHGANAPEETRFPAESPLTVLAGKVHLPIYELPVTQGEQYDH